MQTKILARTKKGVARGLPKKPATLDQSRPKEPMPRPWRPEPSFWAVIESFHIKQTKERADSEGKR